MIVYLLTASSMLLAACVCSVSYIVVNNRLRASALQSHKNDVAETSLISNSVTMAGSEISEKSISHNKRRFAQSIKQGFAVAPFSRVSVFVVSVLSVGIVSFCAQTFTWGGDGIDTIGYIKIVITSLLLMSAAVIDFYTKKIPNFIPIAFLGSGIVMLIAEFAFMRESFLILLAGSLVGLVVGFLCLFAMSLITKGGIGMGDVKLISTMGFLCGIAASFYSFFLATVFCLFVTIILLILKRKKMKDELPFGPFLFLGYILTIILGKF